MRFNAGSRTFATSPSNYEHAPHYPKKKKEFFSAPLPVLALFTNCFKNKEGHFVQGARREKGHYLNFLLLSIVFY